MKNLANFITFSRIIFAILILIVEPFSRWFWLCYLCGGLSDVMDGLVARIFHQQSATGAKLDSIADMAFAISIFIFVICNMKFPGWTWILAILVMSIRFSSYIIGLYKFKTFSSLHTYANKLTGGLLFTFPLMYFLIGMNAIAIIVCSMALISALEEVVIIVKTRELDRDCKSIIKMILSNKK